MYVIHCTRIVQALLLLFTTPRVDNGAKPVAPRPGGDVAQPFCRSLDRCADRLPMQTGCPAGRGMSTHVSPPAPPGLIVHRARRPGTRRALGRSVPATTGTGRGNANDGNRPETPVQSSSRNRRGPAGRGPVSTQVSQMSNGIVARGSRLLAFARVVRTWHITSILRRQTADLGKRKTATLNVFLRAYCFCVFRGLFFFFFHRYKSRDSIISLADYLRIARANPRRNVSRFG